MTTRKKKQKAFVEQLKQGAVSVEDVLKQSAIKVFIKTQMPVHDFIRYGNPESAQLLKGAESAYQGAYINAKQAYHANPSHQSKQQELRALTQYYRAMANNDRLRANRLDQIARAGAIDNLKGASEEGFILVDVIGKKLEEVQQLEAAKAKPISNFFKNLFRGNATPQNRRH